MEWVDKIGGSGKQGAIATTLSPPGSLSIILLYEKLYHRHEQRCRSELEELFHDDTHRPTDLQGKRNLLERRTRGEGGRVGEWEGWEDTVPMGEGVIFRRSGWEETEKETHRREGEV